VTRYSKSMPDRYEEDARGKEEARELISDDVVDLAEWGQTVPLGLRRSENSSGVASP
jgi:hypothetical protein